MEINLDFISKALMSDKAYIQSMVFRLAWLSKIDIHLGSRKPFWRKKFYYKTNFCASSLFAFEMKLNFSVFYSGRKSKKNHFFSPFSIEAIRKGFAFRIVPAYKGLFSSRFSSTLFFEEDQEDLFPTQYFYYWKVPTCGLCAVCLY